VGLDTYAGCGMVLEHVVKTRESEWRPTNVILEGVADEMVKPKGVVDVMVQVGQGAPFQETALVVSHLPGDVEALVSFDTMKKVGLVLGPDHVSVGSEVVVPLAASERSVKSAGAVQQAAEKAKDSAGSAEGDGEKRGLGEDEALAAKAQDWAEAEAANKSAMWDALRQRPEKLGATQKTFAQLEARGAILEVGEGPEGEPVCRIDPAGLEPWWTGRARTRPQEATKKEPNGGKKKGGKVKKEKKPNKRREKAEREAREFEAVAEELEAMAAEREWREELMKADQAREVAVAATAELRGLQESEGSVPSARGLSAGGSAVEQVAPTVRAVEVIERNAKAGVWRRVDARTLLGTEQEVEAVNPDEFCVPQPPMPGDKAEFEAAVDRLAEKAELHAPGSRERYKDVMMHHYGAYCMRLSEFEPGKLKVAPLRLVAKDGPPIRDARRAMSPDDEVWYTEETKKLLRMGILRRPPEWMLPKLFASNPVIVKTTNKDTGELARRLTFDFWPANLVINPGPQRVPLHHELADKAREAALWDKDDGFSGYYQYPLAEESQYLTGVYTPLGMMVFNVMPMGINVAPVAWNTAMADKLQDLPRDRVFVFMDDFIRFTNKGRGKEGAAVEAEHLELLDDFLTKVEEAGLKLKLPKAKHAQQEIEAIGMMYGGGKVWKTEWTTKVVREYPLPRGGKQMERFLALGGYYSNFVEDYAGRVARLRVLVRKKRWSGNELAEGTQEREDFEAMKSALAERMTLEMPDWTKEFIVKSDWSETAMGAALLQAGGDGELRPIAFISRKCTPAEAGVGAPDGEMLALVNAIKRFERFLLGRKFTAYVDQGSLGWLKDKSLSSVNNRRLQASFAYLRQFRFDLLYKKSKEMQDVDALSRVGSGDDEENESVATCCVEVQPVTPQVVAAAAVAVSSKVREAAPVQDKANEDGVGVAQVELEGVWGFDTELRSVAELQQLDDEVVAIRQIRNGKKLQDIEVVPAAREAVREYLSRDQVCENFVEGADGRLYHLEQRNEKSIRQLYVPLTMRGRLVVTKHATGGHRAAEETLAKLRKHYFWPSMRRGRCRCHSRVMCTCW
jgi:hypothetical protein